MPSKKHDPEFMALVRKYASLNEASGDLHFSDGLYVSVHLDFSWKGSIVSIPFSHVVWLIKKGRWPKDNYFIDHINDNAMDNRPANLQELDHAENQAKRRGRMVYRSYGTGEYGYGINVRQDPRDNRYYVTRYLSRGHGAGDLKTIKKGLGGFDTLKEAKIKVKKYIAEIKEHGLDYMPDHGGPKQKKSSLRLMQETKRIRKLRASGHTIQQIADSTGFSQATICNKTKDMHIDKRKTE